MCLFNAFYCVLLWPTTVALMCPFDGFYCVFPTVLVYPWNNFSYVLLRPTTVIFIFIVIIYSDL